ncbi:hypothetical protein LBMAG52_18270 [Planctomycetia bacterium]|nr:hypothetical protein LBMAG52_18270 [Planctomycetia bacterium]
MHAAAGCAPLQIRLSEGLLNRLLTDERSEIAPVRDVIARADVTGRQLTSTRVVVDLKPSSDDAELHLVLTGAVHSNTVGRTSQAAVNTLGRHDVLAVKPVMFDGDQITTRRPQVWVDVHNEHVAASTAFDGTLFGGMARSVAINTTNKQRKQVDAETAEHLSAQLGPQFNRDADRQLAQFNREWRDGLRSQFGNLWPQRLTARSTDSELVLSAAWADAPEMNWQEIDRTSSSNHQVSNSDAVSVWLHESAVNAWLRKLDLAGKTMTESQLREVLESFVSKLGGRVLPRDKKLAAQPLPGAAPLIRLGDKDPVRVTIADGQLQLIVVASIEVGGQTVLAQDEITLPWSSNLDRGEWRLTPGQIVFAKAETGVSLAGMVETMARTQLAAAIPVVTFPEAFPLPRLSPNQRLSELRLASADASAGWLTFSLAVGAAVQPVREPQLRQPVPEEYVPVKQLRSEPVPVAPPRLRAPSNFESRRDRSFFR